MHMAKTRTESICLFKITHIGRDLEVLRFPKPRSKLDFVLITDPCSLRAAQAPLQATLRFKIVRRIKSLRIKRIKKSMNKIKHHNYHYVKTDKSVSAVSTLRVPLFSVNLTV